MTNKVDGNAIIIGELNKYSKSFLLNSIMIGKSIREAVESEYNPLIIEASKFFAKKGLVNLDDITPESILSELKTSRPDLYELVHIEGSVGYEWLSRNIEDMKKFICK